MKRLLPRRIEKQLRKFDGTRSATIEAEPGDYTPSPDEFGEDLARSISLPPLSKGGMAVQVERKEKRGPRWKREAKRAAKAQALSHGVTWATLTKNQKRLAILVEGVAAGRRKPLRRLCKSLGIPVPTEIARGPAPAPAPAEANGSLVKTVLPGVAPMDAATALTLLKAALAAPRPGMGGFRS